jgi:hypothetical protein
MRISRLILALIGIFTFGWACDTQPGIHEPEETEQGLRPAGPFYDNIDTLTCADTVDATGGRGYPISRHAVAGGCGDHDGVCDIGDDPDSTDVTIHVDADGNWDGATIVCSEGDTVEISTDPTSPNYNNCYYCWGCGDDGTVPSIFACGTSDACIWWGNLSDGDGISEEPEDGDCKSFLCSGGYNIIDTDTFPAGETPRCVKTWQAECCSNEDCTGELKCSDGCCYDPTCDGRSCSSDTDCSNGSCGGGSCFLGTCMCPN